MRFNLWILIVVLVTGNVSYAQKAELVQSVEQRAESTWAIAKDIWEWAEPGYQEVKSAKRLADDLEQAGFRVKRQVADIPTAFTAEFGEGKPVIGLLGEYDALPGLSQAAVPVRQSREETTNGHGCGHHLFGAATASAAIAVAEQMKAGKLKGTVRFYGCPAEEGGAGKVFMVRAGLFADCQAVLHWHPSSRNTAGDSSCLSRIAVKFKFQGKSAHASGSPEQGRSALDAIELTAHAAELMREHTPDFTRIHHIITSGGGAPNVVPDFAEMFFYVRHPKNDVVRKLYPRLLLCAQGAALATETKLQEIYLGGTLELLPNQVLSKVVLENLKQLNNLEYTDEERQFAVRIQNTIDNPVPLDSLKEIRDVSGDLSKGSTDVGDVSWVVPTTGFSTACWVPGTPAHSWQATAAGGTTIGKKGMLLAAKVLAASTCDLLQQPALLTSAQTELSRRLGERKYESLLLPNQLPPFDYRAAPARP